MMSPLRRPCHGGERYGSWQVEPHQVTVPSTALSADQGEQVAGRRKSSFAAAGLNHETITNDGVMQ